MKQLAIFDLDGTLLNTIKDLGEAVNFALDKNGFHTHSIASKMPASSRRWSRPCCAISSSTTTSTIPIALSPMTECPSCCISFKSRA